MEASSCGEARDEDGEELEQVIEEMKSSLEFISMFFFFCDVVEKGEELIRMVGDELCAEKREL